MGTGRLTATGAEAETSVAVGGSSGAAGIAALAAAVLVTAALAAGAGAAGIAYEATACWAGGSSLASSWPAISPSPNTAPDRPTNPTRITMVPPAPISNRITHAPGLN